MNARLLIPLDGSPLAEQSLSYAALLGRELPAELVLFHVVSLPSCAKEILSNTGLNTATLIELLDGRATDYLRRVTEQLAAAGLPARQVIRHGLVAEAIVDYAERSDVQMVVMSTHGYSGIRRWMHGSVAERVLQSASVPVLLVRARDSEVGTLREPVAFRRILVPLDGSTVAEQVLPPTISLARAFDAEVVLFQVPIVCVTGSLIGEWFLPLSGDLGTAIPDSRGYLDRVASSLEQQGLRVSTAMQIGAVAESIVGYAEANRMDLVAMCTHGRTGGGRWVLGRVADRVLRAGSRPMLLVRAQ
jgi:nucleotide-binding universal stress UspA family protein